MDQGSSVRGRISLQEILTRQRIARALLQMDNCAIIVKPFYILIVRLQRQFLWPNHPGDFATLMRETRPPVVTHLLCTLLHRVRWYLFRLRLRVNVRVEMLCALDTQYSIILAW